MDNQYKKFLERLKRLDGNLDRAIAAKQMLICADNNKIIKTLDDTYEAHGCRFLLSSARNELLLGLNRILEESKENRCSFKKLIKMRMDEKLDKYISDNILVDVTFEQVTKFRNKYNAFEKRNSEILDDIRTFRNYHLSHTLAEVEKATFKSGTIKYKRLYELLDEISKLFEEFTRLTKQGCWDNTSKNSVWNGNAKKFWLAIAAGVEAKNFVNKVGSYAD